ncbi:MAG: hypothetical protein ACOC3V_01300, partial [bacterium]
WRWKQENLMLINIRNKNRKKALKTLKKPLKCLDFIQKAIKNHKKLKKKSQNKLFKAKKFKISYFL